MSAYYDANIRTKGFIITSIFTWLVPHIFVEIAHHRLALLKSSDWEGEKLAQGLKAINVHSFFAILAGGILLTGTAAGIALSTRDMDDLRMIYILVGMSRLFSAVTLFLLSVQIPKWLGVYHSGEKRDFDVYTLKALRFNIWWNIWRYFGMVYFLLLPFFCCSSFPADIPVYILAGIAAGILVCLGVYCGRVRFKERKRSIGIIMVLILCILSSPSFGAGCYFIAAVKNDDWAYGDLPWYIATPTWLVVTVSIHLWIWQWSKQMLQNEEGRRNLGEEVKSKRFHTAIFHPKHFRGVTSSVVIKDSGVESPAILQQNNNVTIETIEAEPTNIENNILDEESTYNCDKNSLEHQKALEVIENPIPKNQDGDIEDEDTTCAMIKNKCCCCGYTKQERKEKPVTQKIFFVTKWTAWLLASLAALLITIVTIGASGQAKATMENLPKTHHILYGSMNDGPVCAFFDTNSGGPYNLSTFPSADAAIAENYTIAHCGACGACSSPWNNLKLEYTTRSTLAITSKNCAVKRSFQGRDAALQCMYDTVGFDEACSTCWVDCMACASKHCSFIYVMQMIINAVTEMHVAPGAITAATCEEAMCEQAFVPCSGANRRRMNIHSDIERPSDQHCTNVNGSQWELLFGP